MVEEARLQRVVFYISALEPYIPPVLESMVQPLPNW